MKNGPLPLGFKTKPVKVFDWLFLFLLTFFFLVHLVLKVLMNQRIFMNHYIM